MGSDDKRYDTTCQADTTSYNTIRHDSKGREAAREIVRYDTIRQDTILHGVARCGGQSPSHVLQEGKLATAVAEVYTRLLCFAFVVAFFLFFLRLSLSVVAWLHIWAAGWIDVRLFFFR